MLLVDCLVDCRTSILFNYSRPGENFKLQHKWTDLINSRCWLFWRSDTTEVQRLPDWSQLKYPECFFQMVLFRICRGDFAGAISLEHENASRRAQNIQSDIHLVFRQDHGGAGASSHLAKGRRSKKTREKTVQKKVHQILDAWDKTLWSIWESGRTAPATQTWIGQRLW